MESYIEKFKDYVLAHLGRRAKSLGLKIHQVFLCFYLGQTEDPEQPLGVGYITGKGLLIPHYVIKYEFENQPCFFQATKKEKEDGSFEYEYEWSFYAENAAKYVSEDKCKEVIAALKLDDAEILYIGDAEDFALWSKAFPNDYRKSEKIEYADLSYDTIGQILNLKVDLMHLSQSVPPLILKSLYHIGEENNMEPEVTRVYVVPNKEGTDVSVRVFEGREYVAESSLQDLIFSAMAIPNE